MPSLEVCRFSFCIPRFNTVSETTLLSRSQLSAVSGRKWEPISFLTGLMRKHLIIKYFELLRKKCQGYTNSSSLCHITKFSLSNVYLGGRNMREIKPEDHSCGTAEGTEFNVCVTTDLQDCHHTCLGGPGKEPAFLWSLPLAVWLLQVLHIARGMTCSASFCP